MRKYQIVFVPVAIALVLAGFIYWREFDLRDQVPAYKVLLWQLAIWTPWIAGFALLRQVAVKFDNSPFRWAYALGLGTFLVALHFGWFFLVSSNFSPYIGQYGCRFGVFRYFFVFWTFIDIVLVWFAADNFKGSHPNDAARPSLLELTRGRNSYFCEPSQIRFLVAENYYTMLSTTEGIFRMRKPLKYFSEILPSDRFMKIHRSTIVNLNCVSELARGADSALFVVMEDGTRRRVSRNLTKEVLKFFEARTL